VPEALLRVFSCFEIVTKYWATLIYIIYILTTLNSLNASFDCPVAKDMYHYGFCII